MGSAAVKSSKPLPQNQSKTDNKTITIGVFGLDDAGKTSIIKAIEGDPTENVLPTKTSNSILVPNPSSGRNGKTQQNIKIIDVNGERRFRQQSWSQFYDQIHGLIYVVDASEKSRFRENAETLEDLLEHEKIKTKPILIFANKQDLRGAVNNEHDLKRKLDIESLKTRYKIEPCTALPQTRNNEVDEAIQDGFSWLIRTIDDNFAELNSRMTKLSNRSSNDEKENNNKLSKDKSMDSRSKMTLEKLPNINASRNRTKTVSDEEVEDDNYARNNTSSINSSNKKKKLFGTTNNNDVALKKPRDNELKAFRSTYESFPEETPWLSSTSSTLKTSKSDNTLPRLHTKLSTTSELTRQRDVSPLVRDTKSYTDKLSSKRIGGSDEDEEDNYYRQQTSKSTNRFSSNTKKPTTSVYDDDDDDYLKKSNKNYDYDANKSYPRSTDRSYYNTESRLPLAKTTNHSTYNHNDDDEDDDYYGSSTKPTTRFSSNNDYSHTKTTNHSRFDDEGYTTSSSKAVTRSRYDNDDDDDDDENYSKKNTYPSSYDHYNGNGNSRSRFGNDDFSTSKNQSNNINRFRKNMDYDN